MGWIVWIVFGLIAGIIAKIIMPGAQRGGFIVTTILGILGAMIGGWIGTQLGWGSVDGFNLPSLALAVVGAIVLLFVFGFVMNKK